MSTRTVSLSVPVPTKRGVLKYLVAALIGAAITAAIVLSVSGGDDAKTPKPEVFRTKSFAVAAPKGWKSVPTARLGPGTELSIERSGRGVVVVKRSAAPADQSLKKLTGGLTEQLSKRFPDFRFVSARVQQLRGGNAYLFTFVRTKAGTAQSLALVKLGTVNYTIDTVTKSNDTAAAGEAAAIVRSFGP